MKYFTKQDALEAVMVGALCWLIGVLAHRFPEIQGVRWPKMLLHLVFFQAGWALLTFVYRLIAAVRNRMRGETDEPEL